MERTIKEISGEGMAYNNLSHFSEYFFWRVWLQLLNLKLFAFNKNFDFKKSYDYI